jgi:maltodextrin utilization protein YvdJ
MKNGDITENGELVTEKESVEKFAKGKFGLESDTKDGNTVFTDGEKWVIVDEQKDGYHITTSENDVEEIVTGPSSVNNIISRVFTKVAENTAEKKVTKPTKDLMSPAENSFLDYATRGIGKLL